MPGDAFGGGGGSDFENEFVPITSTSLRTPSYLLSSDANTQGGSVSSNFRRLSTVPQWQFEKRFPRILANIDELRSSIRPGFSEMRQARRNALIDARSRGIGNLRQNLRQRRVAGSSFANQQIMEAERQFGEAEAASDAQSFLEELSANREVLNLESAQIYDALNKEMQELGLAAGFAANSADLFSRNQMFASQLALQEAQLEAQAAAGRGEFWGTLLGSGLSLAGSLGGAALLGPIGGSIGGTLGGSLGSTIGGGGGGGFRPLGGDSPFGSRGFDPSLFATLR